jgi:TetR/AcrR family transcriptional regulator of autoinduction and epiphytic fitness
MASTEVLTAPQDGRLLRSERTRRAIVDALRSLHHDGDLRPTANRVAERAGVSLRTVWQHFDDLETLLVAAGRRDFEIAYAYMSPIDGAAEFAGRLAQLVDQRAQMYEALAPVWRAARLQEPFSPQIRRNRDRLLDLGREQLERVFGHELDAIGPGRRATTLSALQVTTHWATWESLRTEFGLDAEAARETVFTLVSSLLSSP